MLQRRKVYVGVKFGNCVNGNLGGDRVQKKMPDKRKRRIIIIRIVPKVQ